MKHEQEILSYIESAPFIYGEPPTTNEVAEVCALPPRTAAAILQRMRVLKRVHVAQWSQDTLGRWNLMRFGPGDAPDAERPAAMTAVQRVQRHRKQKAVVA